MIFDLLIFRPIFQLTSRVDDLEIHSKVEATTTSYCHVNAQQSPILLLALMQH